MNEWTKKTRKKIDEDLKNRHLATGQLEESVPGRWDSLGSITGEKKLRKKKHFGEKTRVQKSPPRAVREDEISRKRAVASSSGSHQKILCLREKKNGPAFRGEPPSLKQQVLDCHKIEKIGPGDSPGQ